MPEFADMAAKCFCGRSALRIHCPQCGSVNIYAYVKKATVIRERGRLEKIQVYRCQTCGKQFDNETWQTNCQAPQRYQNRDKMRADTPEKQTELVQQFQSLAVLKKLL